LRWDHNCAPACISQGVCYAAALPAIYCLHVVVGLNHADSLSVLQRAGAFSSTRSLPRGCRTAHFRVRGLWPADRIDRSTITKQRSGERHAAGAFLHDANASLLQNLTHSRCSHTAPCRAMSSPPACIGRTRCRCLAHLPFESKHRNSCRETTGSRIFETKQLLRLFRLEVQPKCPFHQVCFAVSFGKSLARPRVAPFPLAFSKLAFRYEGCFPHCPVSPRTRLLIDSTAQGCALGWMPTSNSISDYCCPT
jgi:hypothetical protein